MTLSALWILFWTKSCAVANDTRCEAERQSSLASGFLTLAEHIQKTEWQTVPSWTLESWPWVLTWEHLSWRTHRLDPTWEISKRSINGPEAWLSRKLAASPFLSVLPSPIPNVKHRSTKATSATWHLFFIEHHLSGQGQRHHILTLSFNCHALL